MRWWRSLVQRLKKAEGWDGAPKLGLTEEQLRQRFTAAYQWLVDRAKPQRDQDKRDSRRNWWLFADSVPKFRVATQGLKRYIATTETAKHRLFSFLDMDVLPDQKIRSVVSDDALLLGVLSSSLYVQWTLSTGGMLENRPVYNNARCFEPFPFPSDDTGLTPELTERIRSLAEQLDARRRRSGRHRALAAPRLPRPGATGGGCGGARAPFDRLRTIGFTGSA